MIPAAALTNYGIVIRGYAVFLFGGFILPIVI